MMLKTSARKIDLKVDHFLRLLLFLGMLFAAAGLKAQDHVLLKNGDGILECYIIHINDSIITFRTLDPADTYEYEIPVSATYGFLLQNPEDQQEILDSRQHNKLVLMLPRKRRERIFFENQSLTFRLTGDTSLYSRKGKIIQISPDSIQLEIRKKKITERISYALKDFSEFGYTTIWTEIASWVILPISVLQDGSMKFYRRLSVESGWQVKIEPEPESDKVKKRVKRNGHGRKSLQLPAIVKRKVK